MQTFKLLGACVLASLSTALAVDPAVKAALDADLPFGSLSQEAFLKLGSDLALPDGGKLVSELANAAPGGAFDPRDLEKLDPAQLGYTPKWVVTRYSYYNLDWDIPGLSLKSAHPDADRYPWMIIINGGSANVYEFYMDLRNGPGWGQFLAQKLNVLIVTIPGNFKYGGWTEPPAERIAPYVLDRELSADEFKTRTAIYTNELIMEGLRKLVAEAIPPQAELFIIGHSTSGELAFLAKDCAELGPRLKNRYLGWGSGGPARIHAIRKAEQPDFYRRERTYVPVQEMGPRSAEGYVRSRYVGRMNPLYKEGMTDLELAEAWFAAEGRRRPMFKQPLQNHEHGPMIEWRGPIEIDIENELERTGNRFGVPMEDVVMDVMSSHFASIQGYDRMLWIVAGQDRNHWLPEDKMNSWEVFIAKVFRRQNPDSTIRILELDLPMTHYGHVEAPQPLAGVFVEAVKWLVD